MAEDAHPWPEYTHQSFNSAIKSDLSGRDESAFCGPFVRLFYALFPVEGPYVIVSQFNNLRSQNVLLVKLNLHPVFFMLIKPPASLPYDSHRQEADEQMRRQFMDLRHMLTIPTLHGVSAFGTILSFWEYVSSTGIIQPEQIFRTHAALLDDVAPITRWDCDILQQEGANRLRNVVNKIKEICHAQA